MASRNPGKLAELRRLLGGHPWELVDLDGAGFSGELEEPGATYDENSALKAQAVCSATGLAALADDSGIEVPALGGWPGPASARWMGGAATDVDRLHGLLAEVERRCPNDRRARYVCVVTLARPGRETVSVRGRPAASWSPPAGPAASATTPPS